MKEQGHLRRDACQSNAAQRASRPNPSSRSTVGKASLAQVCSFALLKMMIYIDFVVTGLEKKG